ncbi:DUF488 family protein [Halarsenatibacter silvermanii]|uniref:DUF488 domain-containing protein n=1 Tax=Halarsenatibacter silvermanii TaxID=321763 RepID=A0A1G9ISG6_9FIRM|nr:DUF488 family protein [Halarsenatibacter silvermanii]SDL27923.1 Protein of unknown function, DUF488 [Halarsenatibacter silvermanii]
MLKVYTAPMNYNGDKKTLDVTVKSGEETFAPTWAMVMKTKKGEMSWAEYKKKYYEKMRESYRQNRERWQDLLEQEEIVLLCYCSSPESCHRRLLADMLVEAGAEYRGELAGGSEGNSNSRSNM